MHWLSPSVWLRPAPGSDVVTAETNHEPIAAVLDRTVVDGMEWIKVAVGRGYAQDRVTIAWAPHAADVTQAGKTTHVDPVYEPTVPDCPEHPPTIGDLDAMLPLQALYCFGSGDFKLSEAIVRDEGSEESEIVDGSPPWLAEGGNLVAYWLPEWASTGRSDFKSTRDRDWRSGMGYGSK